LRPADVVTQRDKTSRRTRGGSASRSSKSNNEKRRKGISAGERGKKVGKGDLMHHKGASGRKRSA